MKINGNFYFLGIITNYKEVKTLLEQRGYIFESETDTEIIAKLIHHLWVQHPTYSFRELVEQVVQQLVSIPVLNFFFFIFFSKLLLSCLLTVFATFYSIVERPLTSLFERLEKAKYLQKRSAIKECI